MIALNGGEVYFSRQDVNHTGQNYSKNLSLDERFYIFEVRLIEHYLGNYTQINGYDFHKQQEVSYNIPDVYVRQAIVNWLPNNDTLVEIGDYIIDMSDGSIVQELPENEEERAWNSNGKELYFNPISMWDFYSSDDTVGTEIFVYNIDHQTTEKIVEIDEYFQHYDKFALQKEFLDNLTYIPSLDVLGFSYYGLGTEGGFEMSTAGGYCLYSFVTSEINCITDAVEEMLVVIDESVNYTAREQVVYAQWSNSDRFIAFFIRLYNDEAPRLLMYDLETGSYFFINNHYIDGPLGLWSP